MCIRDRDSTEYFYSLPSNRMELWFLLESQRFIQPVFREFYKERDVVMEEYRMRVESEPQGKLLQTFLATAFAAFPYRIMGTGWPSDVTHLRRADAWRFFHEYYVPGNITTVSYTHLDVYKRQAQDIVHQHHLFAGVLLQELAEAHRLNGVVALRPVHLAGA